MGLGDKLSNAKDEAAAKVKEAKGRVTGDDSERNEGRVDGAKASMKQAGERASDAVDDVKDAFKK